MSRYAHAFDYGPASEWAACFVADGFYETRFRDGRVDRHQSTSQLELKASERLFPDRVLKHFMALPIITFRGHSEASAVALWMLLDEGGGQPVLKSYGRYLDEFVVDVDRKWRFRSRLSEVEALIQSLGAAAER